MVLEVDGKRYYGVTRARAQGHGGKWQVQCRIGDRVVTWGSRFEDLEDAARVYDAIAIYLKGPDAKLNFDGRPPRWMGWMPVRMFLEERGVLGNQPWLDNPERFVKKGIVFR